MYIAYKGFDAKLSCRGEQFVIGETYTKDEVPVENLRTCTSQGWHYCDTLEETFKYYPFKDGNRYCKIEVLGNYKRDSYDGKCITTKFNILEEVHTDSIIRKKLEKSIDRLPLSVMRKLQDMYPVFFGGSSALLLYGCKLTRKIDDTHVDLDVIAPYYIKIRKTDLLKAGLPVKSVDNHGAKASGNDFDETVSIYFDKELLPRELIDSDLYNDVSRMDEYLKLDIKIDPKQSYNIVNYKGDEYRLSKVEPILDAKLRYAMNGQQKHAKDAYDMLGINYESLE